jgi:hypothetical protein
MIEMTLQYKGLVIMHRGLNKDFSVLCSGTCYVYAVNLICTLKSEILPSIVL